LSAVPPANTVGGDGARSGNPAVREAVAAGQPQVLCWVAERPGGGRGFGFTGGHWHWNWGNDNFRKVVLNAIVWTAGMEVPSDGVNSTTPTAAELLQNLDEEKPANFDDGSIKKLLTEWKAAGQ
jgi:hypothetical protein